jgi:hypothetical protein
MDHQKDQRVLILLKKHSYLCNLFLYLFTGLTLCKKRHLNYFKVINKILSVLIMEGNLIRHIII